MKFFVPATNTDDEKMQVIEGIIKFVGAPISDRRIHRLRWIHDGREFAAEVGKETQINNELVIAILFELGRKLYHVCTPNRGVLRGIAVYAGESDVEEFVDFDAT